MKKTVVMISVLLILGMSAVCLAADPKIQPGPPVQPIINLKGFWVGEFVIENQGPGKWYSGSQYLCIQDQTGTTFTGDIIDFYPKLTGILPAISHAPNTSRAERSFRNSDLCFMPEPT